MGSFGLGEFFLIIAVAVCVLKPSQLYRLSQIMGKLWAKTFKQFQDIKSEINQSFKPPE